MERKINSCVKTQPTANLQLWEEIGVMRLVLLMFNTLFVIAGITILFIIYQLRFTLSKITLLTPSNHAKGLLLLILVGVCIVLTGSWACFGLKRKNHLYIFGYLLTAILLMELTAGFSMFKYRAYLRNNFEMAFKAGMEAYCPFNARKSGIALLQSQLECCGLHSYMDWLNTSYHKLPRSCCKDADPAHPKITCEVYPIGCYDRIESFLNSTVGVVAVAAFCLGALPLIGSVLVCFISKYLDVVSCKRLNYDEIE